jgi:hypothetical protein
MVERANAKPPTWNLFPTRECRARQTAFSGRENAEARFFGFTGLPLRSKARSVG